MTTTKFVADKQWRNETLVHSPTPRVIEIFATTHTDYNGYHTPIIHVDDDITMDLSFNSGHYVAACSFRMEGDDSSVYSCQDHEDSMFAIPRHRLPTLVKDWQRELHNQNVIIAFNDSLQKIEHCETRRIITNSFASVHRSNLRKIVALDQTIVPNIARYLKGCHLLIGQSVMLHAMRVDSGNTRTQTQYVEDQFNDRFVHIAAMCFLCANELIQMTMDFDNEDVGTAVNAAAYKWEHEESWVDSNLEACPYHPYLTADHSNRMPDENEVYAVLSYLSEVLIVHVIDEIKIQKRDRHSVLYSIREAHRSKHARRIGTMENMSEEMESIVTDNAKRMHYLSKSANTDTAVKVWAAGKTLTAFML
jgi:hypothetical protein